MKRYKNLHEYESEHADFLAQPIVKSFLEDESHRILLKEVVVEGKKAAKEQLDLRFVEHYYLYRLMKYISILSHYFSNHYDRERRKQKKHYLLFLDQPCKREGVQALISSLSMDRENGESSRMNTEFTLLDIAEDEVLYNSLLQLTEKERTILQLIYIDQWTQTEVAKWFKDTPQNIGKTKKRALVKIKNELEKGRE